MESTIATVISVSRDAALVSIDTATACPRCASGKGCGAGILGDSGSRRNLEVPVMTGMKIAAGDRVRLSLQSAHLLRAALLAYGTPLAGILVSLAGASWLYQAPTDGQAALIALAGFAAGLLTGRQLIRRDSCLERLVPSITERIVTDTQLSPDAI